MQNGQMLSGTLDESLAWIASCERPLKLSFHRPFRRARSAAHAAPALEELVLQHAQSAKSFAPVARRVAAMAHVSSKIDVAKPVSDLAPSSPLPDNLGTVLGDSASSAICALAPSPPDPLMRSALHASLSVAYNKDDNGARLRLQVRGGIAPVDQPEGWQPPVIHEWAASPSFFESDAPAKANGRTLSGHDDHVDTETGCEPLHDAGYGLAAVGAPAAGQRKPPLPPSPLPAQLARPSPLDADMAKGAAGAGVGRPGWFSDSPRKDSPRCSITRASAVTDTPSRPRARDALWSSAAVTVQNPWDSAALYPWEDAALSRTGISARAEAEPVREDASSPMLTSASSLCEPQDAEFVWM